MTTGVLGRRFSRKDIGMSSEAARRFTEALQQRAPSHWNFPVTFIRDIQDLYDRSLPNQPSQGDGGAPTDQRSVGNISAAEALYAFCGHLLSLPYPMTFSREHNPARISDLIDQFCRLNNIPEPRKDWDKRLNPKFYREVTAMNENCIMHQQPLSLCPQCRDGAVNQALMEKNGVIKDLREVLIRVSVEDCGCCRDHNHEITHQCPRCRALEVLESTK